MKGLVAIMLLFFASLSAKADTLEAYMFEYIPDFPDSIIEQRLKVIESQTNVPLPFNERVRAFVDYFSIKNRQYTRVMLRRKGIYFPVFEEKLKEYGLPDELKYLSIIESGLNPQAKSRVGAAGLWQFMPYTGKVYGLDQDWYVDERHDPEKSTVAACKFLKDLNGMFDNWLYAVAAYNCGPGNVRKAIRRSGYKKDFWDVYAYLPRETRGYVPQFIAMTYLMKYHEEHFIFVDSLEYVPDHDVLTVNQYLNLEVFANCSNTCLEDIRKLNPELRFNAVPEGRSYALRVPKHNHGFIMENLTMLMDTANVKGKEAELAKAALRDGSTVGKDKVYYRVRSGDVLGTIAERYGVGVSELRRWNNIHGSMIRVGQTLTIYTNKAPAKATTTVSSKPQPLPDDKTYIVKPGDSLWIISRKYEGLSIEKLKEINNLKSNDLKPGQKLKLG